MANDDKLLDEMIAGMRYHLGERKAGMVFIDTLNHSLNGLNESDSATANAYFKVVDKIKSAVGGSTVTVHHFGKDTSRGSRGTVAFEAGWDTVFFIDQHHHNPITGVHYIAVLAKKQKSGSANYYFYLKSRSIELPASEIPQDDEPHIEGMPKDDDKCSLVLEWSDEEEFAEAAEKWGSGDAKPKKRAKAKWADDILEHMHKVLSAITSNGCYVYTKAIAEQLHKDLHSRFGGLNVNTITKRLNDNKDGQLAKYYRGEIKNSGTWGLPMGPVDYTAMFQDATDPPEARTTTWTSPAGINDRSQETALPMKSNELMG